MKRSLDGVPALPRQVLRWALGGLLLVGSLGLVLAQDEDRLEVAFSYDGTTLFTLGPDRGGPALRPNYTQPIYFHVTNPGARTKKLEARLLIHRKNRPPLEFASANVEVPGGGSQILGPWKLGKAIVPPPPVPTTPPVATPPVTAPVVPLGVDLEGPAFEVRLQLSDRKNKPVELKVPLEILVPSEYVEVTERHYADHKLTVKVRSKKSDSFRGTACPVQLSLPARGLAQATPLEGALKQVLEGPDQEAVLFADKLQLLQDSRFHLAVDSYPRGFVYSLDAVGTDPVLRLDKELRLRFVPFLAAMDKVRVLIETDNVTSKEDATLRIALFRGDEKIRERRLAGPHETGLRLLAPEPDGALPIQTLVRDWAIDLAMGDTFGTYHVEATLTYKAEGGYKTIRTNPPRLALTLDRTPPEGVQFLSPKKLQRIVRGTPLLIKAQGWDPESDIADVFFFAGKPTPEHKPPPNAVLVRGKQLDRREWTWVPEEPLLLADARGRIDLGVIFVNRAGQSSSATVAFDIVEPEPKPKSEPAKPKPAILTVSVREGERPQNGLPVELRDAQGVLKFKGTTGDVKNKDGVAEPGKIVFKDLPAGTYKVSAVKSASRTRAETTTTVKDGDEKTVNLPLFRGPKD